MSYQAFYTGVTRTVLEVCYAFSVQGRNWGLGSSGGGVFRIPGGFTSESGTLSPTFGPPKTDLFKKRETIVRNPKKVGFSGHRQTLNLEPLNYRILGSALSLCDLGFRG